MQGDLMTIKILDRHIEITPGVVGGTPRIAGRRITVQDIAIWHEWMGRSADEIATEYDLTLADIYAALAYYYDHRSEIDGAIKDSEALVEKLRQQIPSKIIQKLYERKDQDLHG
jgi:uncharacterized protein (DUF433 family)